MKSKNILIPLAILFVMASCSKSLQQRDLSFGVSSFNSAKQATTNFQAGDTVSFVFSGNPDQISFFSGEVGRRYQYVTRTSDSTSATDTLKFSTLLNTAGDGGLLQLLVSSSFEKYTQINSQDSASLSASYPSGWTDISNRVNWATDTNASVSKVALNDFAAAGKPVFLAFRYSAAAGVAQSKWTIKALNLLHYVSDTAYCIDSTNYIIPTTFPARVSSPGWGVASIANPLVSFTMSNGNGGPANSGVAYSQASGATNASFTVTGNNNPDSSLSTETWVLSGPINLYQVLPDAGVPVKDMTTNASTTIYAGTLSNWASYAYRFNRPGTYTVTFLAGTSTRDASSTVAKSITITVQ